MNFVKSFTYIFDDPDWFNKLWKPVLCALIPIIGPLVLRGYTQNVTKRVALGYDRPLHEMDFGDELSAGFRITVVQLVYAIPLLLLIIPIAINQYRMIDTLGVADPAEALKTAGNVTSQLALYLLSFLINIVFFFIFPIISGHVAVQGTFSSGFEFKKMFNMVKKDAAAWLTVLAGSLVAGFISPAGLVVFIIGVLATSAYGRLMVSHLTGQAYRLTADPLTFKQTVFTGN